MVTWTRLAQWHHWLTCQNGMRNSYKAPSLKEKLLRINLIQRKAFWVYVCFSVFRVNTQDWSIPIIQSQVVNHKQRNLSITKWTCQVVLMYTYTYMCICLGYFSITVNIPDQGCYQRVHWVNRFRGWVCDPSVGSMAAGKQACCRSRSRMLAYIWSRSMRQRH